MAKFYNVVTWNDKHTDEYWEYYGTDEVEALEEAAYWSGRYGENMEVRIYNHNIQNEVNDDWDYDTIDREVYDKRYRAELLEGKYRNMFEKLHRNCIYGKIDSRNIEGIEYFADKLGEIVEQSQEDYHNFNYDTQKMVDKAEKALKHLEAFIDLYFYDEDNTFDF